MINRRNLCLLTIISGAFASQWVPHPLNFTAGGAIALFAGAQFEDKKKAFLVPVCTLLINYLMVGLHALMPWVFGSYCLIVCLGFALRERSGPSKICGVSVLGSLLFFLITNFGVWAMLDTFPKTGAGLAACYLAGLHSFARTVTGDCFYSALLFGGMGLAELRFTSVRRTLPLPESAPAL
jgi:hypothetical protein